MLSVYRKGTRRYFLARIIEKHDNVTSSKFAICYSNNADNTKAKCTIKMINEAFGDLQKAKEKLDERADSHGWSWTGENKTMPQYKLVYKAGKTVFALEE